MLKSIQPSLSKVKELKRFKGRYFLVSCLQKHSKKGEPIWEICLSDSTATIKVYCFDQRHFFSSFKANSLVHIEVCAKSHHGKNYLRCVYLEEVAQYKLINKLDISSLPSSLCPYPSQLKEVVVLFYRITNKHLKQFVSQTLLQPDVATKYINCPTRVKVKQSETNCLLSQALLVAAKLLSNQSLSVEQRDLAIAFSILHEIGKINKYTSDSTLSAIGVRADIEDLSMDICVTPLTGLKNTSPQLHYQLRFLLSFGFVSKRSSFNLDSFYSCLDHLSASWRNKQIQAGSAKTNRAIAFASL
ncbi:hypothetical protein [Paraglaciecola sp.]|uniref:hypothetical protein n=1 Tax=Paraglaciecola sp. TaxID=1920173 RepID=UPI0032636D74